MSCLGRPKPNSLTRLFVPARILLIFLLVSRFASAQEFMLGQVNLPFYEEEPEVIPIDPLSWSDGSTLRLTLNCSIDRKDVEVQLLHNGNRQTDFIMYRNQAQNCLELYRHQKPVSDSEKQGHPQTITRRGSEIAISRLIQNFEDCKVTVFRMGKDYQRVEGV